MTRVARFYKAVEVAEGETGFAVHLDGKLVKTPGRSALSVPTRALAEAIAEEWRGQGDQLDPATMKLTHLAFAAIDVAPGHRARLVDEILAFGRSDLLCYRAEAPALLVKWQAEAWDPLLDWAAETLGAKLVTGTGIAFVEQPAASLAALAASVSPRDDFAIVALHEAASITGSLVLGLALVGGRLAAAEAFALSWVDETFQAETWGTDAEAEARAGRLLGDLTAIESFLQLARSWPTRLTPTLDPSAPAVATLLPVLTRKIFP